MEWVSYFQFLCFWGKKNLGKPFSFRLALSLGKRTDHLIGAVFVPLFTDGARVMEPDGTLKFFLTLIVRRHLVIIHNGKRIR